MTQADADLQEALGAEAEIPEAKKGRKKGNAYGAIAAKKDKAAKLLVLVFEPEGGAPYTVEVKPEKGQFNIPNSDQAFKIARGSVWIENGVPRTCVNAGNPITVNIHTLTGSDIMHPTSYNTDINNNYAEQVLNGTRTKPFWAKGTTWGLLGSAVIMGLLMFWLIKTVGGGFEEIREAISGIKIAAEQASSGGGGTSGPVPTPEQQQAGHSPIAPGGV